MNEKKRDLTIDIAKAIGIVLVVLGHTNFVGNNFIYQFHLPLFFFLSGFVFNENHLKEPKKFLLKKIKSLYIPFIAFEILFLLLHNFFVNINFYTDLSKFTLYMSPKTIIQCIPKILSMGYGEQLAGPLWFLIATLEINILFAVLLMILNRINIKNDLVLILINVAFYYIGCYTDLPRMLSQSMIGMLFYCLGYLYKNNKNKIKIDIKIFLFCIIILIILSYINVVDISKLNIEYKSLLIISGLAGIYVIMYLSTKISFLNNKFVLYCGQNTIYILALHLVSFKLLMICELFIYNEEKNLLGMFPVYQKYEYWCILFTFVGVNIPLVTKYFTSLIVNSLKKGVTYAKQVNKN